MLLDGVCKEHSQRDRAGNSHLSKIAEAFSLNAEETRRFLTSIVGKPA